MAQNQQQRRPDAQFTTRPFEVRIDGARHGAFVDVRDAIDAAKIVSREHPHALVGVFEAATGQIVVEPDA